MSFSDHSLVSFLICFSKEVPTHFTSDLKKKINTKLLDDDFSLNAIRQKLKDLASAEGEEFGVNCDLFKEETKILALERSSLFEHEEKK